MDTANLEKAFRELRAAWFAKVLYRDCHEREWESVEMERLRENDNNENRQAFDDDTQAIIDGLNRKPAPLCIGDIGRVK